MKKNVYIFSLFVLILSIFLVSCVPVEEGYIKEDEEDWLPQYNPMIIIEPFYRPNYIGVFGTRIIDLETGVVCYSREDAIFCIPLSETTYQEYIGE